MMMILLRGKDLLTLLLYLGGLGFGRGLKAGGQTHEL
jgi:hypothetical protein